MSITPQNSTISINLDLMTKASHVYYQMDSKRRLINNYYDIIDDFRFKLEATIQRYQNGLVVSLMGQVYSEYLLLISRLKSAQNKYISLSSYFRSLVPNYSVNTLYIIT